MLDQVIKLTSKDPGQVTISIEIKNGDIVGLTARDAQGNNYNVCLQLKLEGQETTDGPGENYCCCPDPAGGMMCQWVNGPCPNC